MHLISINSFTPFNNLIIIPFSSWGKWGTERVTCSQMVELESGGAQSGALSALVESKIEVNGRKIYDLLLLLLLLSCFSCVRLCATPQTAAHQAPLSLGFSRQEHWSGLPFPSPVQESEKWKWSRSVVSDSSWPHGPQPTRLLHPWDSPGKSTGVGCHCLLRLSS